MLIDLPDILILLPGDYLNHNLDSVNSYIRESQSFDFYFIKTMKQTSLKSFIIVKDLI